jgi:hypothetical protein
MYLNIWKICLKARIDANPRLTALTGTENQTKPEGNKKLIHLAYGGGG